MPRPLAFLELLWLLWTALCFFQHAVRACSTLVDNCGSICMCKDVITRSNEEAQSCYLCMPPGMRGCFCQRGFAWEDSSRRRCVSFSECRGRGPSTSQEGEKHGGESAAKQKEHKFFNYEPGRYGPDNWKHLFPDCNGRRQSPINIPDEDSLMKDNLMPDLDLNPYNSEYSELTLTNNGHTAKISMPDNQDLIIDNGRGSRYKLLQFHFHWGTTEREGSEHTVNGKAFPAELHFVHKKLDSDRIESSKLYLVVGVLLEVGDQENGALNVILDKIRDVRDPDTKVPIDKPIRFRELLPADISSYYRYDGSFTTPGCDEVVDWNLFRHTLPISRRQRDILSNSLTQNPPPGSHAPQGSYKVLNTNFRPTMPLNGRRVLVKYGREEPQLLHSQQLQQSSYQQAPLALALEKRYVRARYMLSDRGESCNDACRSSENGPCSDSKLERLRYHHLRRHIARLGGYCFDEAFEDKDQIPIFNYDRSNKAFICEDSEGTFISTTASCVERSPNYRKLCRCG